MVLTYQKELPKIDWFQIEGDCPLDAVLEFKDIGVSNFYLAQELIPVTGLEFPVTFQVAEDIERGR